MKAPGEPIFLERLAWFIKKSKQFNRKDTTRDITATFVTDSFIEIQLNVHIEHRQISKQKSRSPSVSVNGL